MKMKPSPEAKELLEKHNGLAEWTMFVIYVVVVIVIVISDYMQ